MIHSAENAPGDAAKKLREARLRGQPDMPLTAALHETLGQVAVPLNWDLKGDADSFSDKSHLNRFALETTPTKDKRRFIELAKRYYAIEGTASLPDVEMHELLSTLHRFTNPDDVDGKRYRSVIEQCLTVLELGPPSRNDPGGQITR